MGIVADLQCSEIRFANPRSDVVFNLIDRYGIFVVPMQRFDVTFCFRFDPNPRHGVGGNPTSRQYMEIGIVQNVIYQKLSFQFSGQSRDVEYRTAALDSGAPIWRRPFYNEPVYIHRSSIDPGAHRNARIPYMLPVAEVFYTSSGYGRFLDPLNSETGVAIDNRPQSVNIYDQPFYGGRLRPQDTRSVLTAAEHIVAFQLWLIVKTSNRVQILAHTTPFSLVSWITFQQVPGGLTTQDPGYETKHYSQNGITRRVNRNARNVATVRMRRGNGGRSPVLGGVTAGDRSQSWLRESGLAS